MSSAKKLLTLQDFLDAPPDARMEMYEGELHPKAMPSGAHSTASSEIFRTLANRFRRSGKENGTGGWWIKSECSVRYPRMENIFTHDIVGWKRDRVPVDPKAYPVIDRPDWVCEVSLSTWKKDSGVVWEALEHHEVPFYWIADIERNSLLVLEFVNGKYVKNANLFLSETRRARVRPFDAVELDLHVLFGLAEEEDEEDA